ncbi:DNA repair protein RadA [Portibacter lacus]|uniref:DNA repair protein RadA n=1 Tax=Portibacter lacus TaxID=1099794 RepID=A0AA37WGS2_9BACT|nr:DNA repair protein RadA [Portibacter lacus]GLR18569.1 DNA repair protein RadA [Portibacter lacus]
MAKAKTVYICSNCGAHSAKWIGNCPSCNEWNTYQEEIIHKDPKAETRVKYSFSGDTKVIPIPLSDVQQGNIIRKSSGDAELDRVLGGGIVRGGIVLLGGQPGIGKSTLLLQLAIRSSMKILYVSGEESEEQIKMRADRIGITNKQCIIYTETSIPVLLKEAMKQQPDLVIIDSIQTLRVPELDSSPGSITQVRESTNEIMKFAKTSQIPVFIIGHINKEGAIAGPKLLEHMVDTVLLFEGDQNYSYRIIRTQKNRFGSTDELAIYEMTAEGLREVSNPSEILLSQSEELLSGSSVAATMEGRRTMLIEIQALVSTAVYGTPQRSVTGYDLRRLHMLLAVLEKRVGFPIGQYDVFLNIAGGIKVIDPATDLAIVSSLISSMQDISISREYAFAGEVGLSGEIRAVRGIELRIQEAARLGFTKIYIPKSNAKGLDLNRFSIEVVMISKIETLFNDLFG